MGCPEMVVVDIAVAAAGIAVAVARFVVPHSPETKFHWEVRGKINFTLYEEH